MLKSFSILLKLSYNEEFSTNKNTKNTKFEAKDFAKRMIEEISFRRMSKASTNW